MKTIHLTIALVALICFIVVGASVTAHAKTPTTTSSTTTPNKTTPPPKPNAPGSGEYNMSLLAKLNLPKEEKAEMKKIKDAEKAELEQKLLAVLTPEQKAQLQQLIANAGIKPVKSAPTKPASTKPTKQKSGSTTSAPTT